MKIYVKIYLISIYSLFPDFQLWFNHIHWFYPYRSLRHQVTSQIRSHIEHLIQTYYIRVFTVHFVLEIGENFDLNGGF